MANEIELKLDVTPAAADAIAASGLLDGAPAPVAQHATYFDTADHDLFEAGLSLRIRRTGETRIQTVKAGGGAAAGLFARGEWERPVAGDTPVLDDATPVPALLGQAAGDDAPRLALAPIFAVAVERRIWTVHEGDATIEIALDRGAAIVGDPDTPARTAPIVEIELELKAGSPAALFAFARRLDAVAPVRPGVLAKSERGYRLLDPARTAFKAEPVALDTAMNAADAFAHIVHACLRQFRLNEALLAAGRQADTLHQARVALRRLRSAFAIFRPIARGAEADRLRAELRWLAGALGEARNLDVLLDRASPGPVRDRITTARAAAYDRVIEALAAPRARALMLDLLEWTATGDWRTLAETTGDRHRPARAFATAALARFRRKVKKDGHDLTHADDETRHEVRKDAKKLRYAAEFFRALFDGKPERRRYKAFIAALETLQDQLGTLNDLATAPAMLTALGLAADAVPAAAEKKALVAAADDAVGVLVDAKRFWR